MKILKRLIRKERLKQNILISTIIEKILVEEHTYPKSKRIMNTRFPRNMLFCLLAAMFLCMGSPKILLLFAVSPLFFSVLPSNDEKATAILSVFKPFAIVALIVFTFPMLVMINLITVAMTKKNFTYEQQHKIETVLGIELADSERLSTYACCTGFQDRGWEQRIAANPNR